MKKTTRLLLFAAAVAVLFALAAFGVSAAEYNEDGSTMDATLASALADAQNEDVTINLSGTWTFAGDTVYGSSASIPSHTITINGDPDGDTVLNGEISSGGNMVTLWGNFVFTNVKFTGAKSTTASPRIDAKNGLYFPEGCSCIIASGCDGYTDGTNGFNLAGDYVEVNSGKFRTVAAQMLSNPNTVAINNPKIRVGGDAAVAIACGLGYNTANITGSADIQVTGSAAVTEFLVAGGYYSNSSSLGGTLIVNTTGDSEIRNISAITGSNGITKSTSARPTYNITVGSSATLTIKYAVSVGIANGNMSDYSYLDANITLNPGVSFTNDTGCGYLPGPAYNQDYTIKAGGTWNVTLNGAMFATAGKTLYAGSRLRAEGSDCAADITLNLGNVSDGMTVYPRTTAGDFNGYLYAGSFIGAVNGTQSGTTTLNVNGSAAYAVYGGSNLYADGAKQTANATVYMGSAGAPVAVKNFRSVFGGCNIQNATAEFNAEYSKIVAENVDWYGGSVFAGSSFAAGSHSADSVGGVHRADSILHIKSGNFRETTSTVTNTVEGTSYKLTYTNVVVLISGGCSGYQTVAPDEKTEAGGNDDKIAGGFSHVGNVHVIIDGGTINCRTSFSGYSVNVDGSSTIEISGGSFPRYRQRSKPAATATSVSYTEKPLSFLALESASSTWHNTCSISGDMKIYISGGTFTTTRIRVGTYGTGSMTYIPATGYAVVGGNLYWEISGGTFASSVAPGMGADNTVGNVCIKFVGDSFDLSGLTNLMMVSARGDFHANTSNKRTLDLTHVTGASQYAFFTKAWDYSNQPVFMYTNTGAVSYCYPAVMDLASFTVSGTTYTEGDGVLDSATLGLTFNTAVRHSGQYNTAANFQSTTSYNGTYAKFTEWDDYASCDEYKNASLFTLSVPNYGKFTTGVDVTLGTENASIPVVNNDIATVEAAARDEFDYLGVSIRPSDNGLRARAQVNETLRGRTIAADGYKVKSYGVIVSKTAAVDLTYGAAKTSNVIAYNGTTDVYFKDGDNYVFAATITNIPAANYNTPIEFRPYVELEDENGDTLVVYADMTGVSNFLSGETIVVSLREVAVFIRDNETAFYDKNKATLDAIIG